MGTRKASTPTESEPLTEQTIQKRLNHFFASWKYNVDGLYVFAWESDKLIWTKAGYIYEFEIKISRSDYKNDFKHKGEKHMILSSAIAANYQTEHAAKRKPNYFYYAVPEGMIQPDEVPPYAGLIWIKREYQYVRQSFVIVREAPRLHKEKYTDGELNLGEKFYYNFKSAQQKQREAERDIKELRERLNAELAAHGQEMTYEQMKLKLKIATQSEEYWKEEYGKIVRDNIQNNAERKRLRHAILQLQPDFDFRPIEDEVDKLYPSKRNQTDNI